MVNGLIETDWREDIQLLRDEREALRDEIADLRAQLDFEAERLRTEVAALAKRNRTLARRWYDAFNGRVYEAIQALRTKGRWGSEVEGINHVAGEWLRLTEHGDRVREAANRIDHAGLCYLALEADWADILGRYGAHEAADFIGRLVRTWDQREVDQIVEEWENPDLSNGG